MHVSWLPRFVFRMGVMTESETTGEARAAELLGLMQLEAIEQNLFLGRNDTLGRQAIFGGQVLAQALRSACATVDAEPLRKPHSLHGYFIRRGDLSRPVLFEVERIRDGRSFATRRVVAIQNGEAILNLDVSLQIDETGLEHSDPIPNVPRPRDLEPDLALVERYLEAGHDDGKLTRMAGRPRPFELRSVFPVGSAEWQAQRYWNPVWMKFLAPVDASDQMLARSLLAYASDMGLIGTSVLPHQEQANVRDLQMVSLDHALWIHRDVDVGDWLLYHRSTTWAGAARAVVHGAFFNRRGDLVASVSQEGLLRQPPSA